MAVAVFTEQAPFTRALLNICTLLVSQSVEKRNGTDHSPGKRE